MKHEHQEQQNEFSALWQTLSPEERDICMTMSDLNWLGGVEEEYLTLGWDFELSSIKSAVKKSALETKPTWQLAKLWLDANQERLVLLKAKETEAKESPNFYALSDNEKQFLKHARYREKQLRKHTQTPSYRLISVNFHHFAREEKTKYWQTRNL